MAVFSIAKNLVNGLSGKTSRRAAAKAVAASEKATATNNAVASEVRAENSALFKPYVNQGNVVTSYIQGLLGVGGDKAGAQSGFDQFRKSSGYDFRLDEGSRAITGNAAARGQLKSGSTLKALAAYGQNLASDEFGSYYNRLAGQQGVGLTAAAAQSGVANNYSAQVQQNNSVNASNVGNAALTNAANNNAITTGVLKLAGSLFGGGGGGYWLG